MAVKPLGRLSQVDNLQEYWEAEDKDFTPWLAESDNIKLVGAAIGAVLQVESVEKDVGRFRADILCKDQITESSVLIENQLGRTDHSHLGQLLTYAAGLEAAIIVWIAKKFTDEHRAALDWLNQVTDQRYNFYGLEIELWSIDNGLAAPKFNIVSKPNTWVRDVHAGAEQISTENLTKMQLLQLEYWKAFQAYLRANDSLLKPHKPQPQNWTSMKLGRSGIHLSAVISSYNSGEDTKGIGEIRAEVVMIGPRSKSYFSQLEQSRLTIEAKHNGQLFWYNPEDGNQLRIFARRDADIIDKNDWARQHMWLREQLESLKNIFSPLAQNLT